MMRRKLLHKMKEVSGATSRMMKDELIVGEQQVDGTWLLTRKMVPITGRASASFSSMLKL